MISPARSVAPIATLALVAVLALASGCSAGHAPDAAPRATTSVSSSGSASVSGVVPGAVSDTDAAPASTPVASAARHSAPSSAPGSSSNANGPVIVIDPGHSVSLQSIDQATGLNDSDYENEPEMRDVFAVALLVKAKLEAAGYRVVMTKNSVTQRISLGARAAVANNAHAALALSIHDQAGSSGGIGFNQGNNIVYYQSVGTYRETPSGKKVYFTDSSIAATSRKYGQIFQSERAAIEGHTVALQANTGYDLGTRGLAPGDIWIVQLLAKVPWIYNEAGGNSAGISGLDAGDKGKYADALVASVERCVPIGG